MKKRWIMAVFLFGNIALQAQDLRHVKGQNGIEIGGGATRIGGYGQLGYSHYFGPKIYGKVSAGYENATTYEIKTTSIFLDFTGNYTLFNLSKILYVNAVVGLTGNLDSYKDYAPATGTKINYGALLGGEAEIFLSSKLVLLLNARQSFLFGYQKNIAYYGGGVKVLF